MDSDLAWVNGKSGRQSWRYADAFKRSIISGCIYHFILVNATLVTETNNHRVPTNDIILLAWASIIKAIQNTANEGEGGMRGVVAVCMWVKVKSAPYSHCTSRSKLSHEINNEETVPQPTIGSSTNSLLCSVKLTTVYWEMWMGGEGEQNARIHHWRPPITRAYRSPTL